MSVIRPSEYKTIVEEMSVAYSQIRDAINDGAGNGAVEAMGDAIEAIDAANDSESLFGADTDPRGSIMNDLGTAFFKASNSDITPAKAKQIAADLQSDCLRKLNSHVV